jgi:TatD DNase family protein
MLIDIHCHVDFYPEDKIEKVVETCKKKKTIFVNQGTRPNEIEKVLALGEKYPETAKIALGIYPLDALSLSDKEFDEKIKFIRKNKDNIVAIGEVGMDFHEEEGLKSAKKQEENLVKFINLAKELGKPIIIHSRKAEKECIDILEREKAQKVIMHCFSGNLKLVQRIIDNKWALTIPTSVTRSEHFQKIIAMTPIEQLFCETDSPYLHPDKTQRDNTPENVVFSYEAIAKIKGLKLKGVEDKIKENYNKLMY